MRTEEFITLLSKTAQGDDGYQKLRAGLPLGLDAAGEIVLSQTQERPFIRHTCVTGVKRTAFIKRFILALSCLYEKGEANFLVLSSRNEYGELLRLKSLDITVPFVNDKSCLESAKACILELLNMYATGKGYPRLFLVLDGLEELDGCNQNGDLEEYRAFFDILARRENVYVITGVELMKSIFSGYPGAFVGVGNCLVTTREEGKADVTYAGDDSSLSQPTAVRVPDSPSVMETVIFLNALSAENNGI